MAKLAVTVAVVFLLLAVSPAHFQEVDLPEHDASATVEDVAATVEDVSATVETAEAAVEDAAATAETAEASLSESQKEIFLPSADVGFDPANLEFNPQDTESKPEFLEVETDPDTHTVPLTMISFRPNSRQFPRRPMLPFHHRHRLNYRQRRQFKPWDPRFQKKNAIPFGDDMIRSDDGMTFDAVHPGGVRKVPAKWWRFQRRHEGPRFFFRDETMFSGPHHFHGDEDNDRKVTDGAFFRGPRHFPMVEENERKGRDEAIFRGPRHFHGEEEHERKGHEHHHHHHEHHRHKEEEGGFLKNLRKFLNH